MEDNGSLARQVAALTSRVAALEDEREIRSVCARYGFYADHGMSDQWLDLFTDDAVIDTVLYIADHDGAPTPDKFRPTRSVGREELRAIIESPAHKAIHGASQHHMDGTPATITFLDENSALMLSYSVTYAKNKGDYLPGVQYQSHNMNRLIFRRVDGAWKIAENLQRRMGHPETASLYSDA